MKKVLSLVLSFAILLSTITVLTLLPASAETGNNTAAQNLIINGDANGVDGKIVYTEDDVADSEYTGQILAGLAVGWRGSDPKYADCKTSIPSANTLVPSGYFSDYSKTDSLIVNNWRQAMQDVKLEAGKTYRVSAKIAVNPISYDASVVPSTTWTYSMMLDSLSQYETNKKATGKDWFVTDKITLEQTGETTDENGTVTKKHYAGGDFKDYTFTFNSDDFINEYNIQADSDGYYHARFVIRNDSGAWLLFDDVSIYEVYEVKGGVMSGSENGGIVSIPETVIAGDPVTFSATAFYGNEFLGWFDKDGNFVSENATFITYTYTELYAKFITYNVIKDGGFENEAVGTTKPVAFTNEGGYSTNYPADFEIVENTEHTDFLGNHVLKYYSNASANGHTRSQYDICLPVEVKKNTKYLFRFYFKNTTATRVGFTVSEELSWDGQAIIDYSAYYGTYGKKSTNTWSYGSATAAQLQNSNAAIKTHGAAFSNTDWNEMYVTFDSLDNEGTLYLVIGMLHGTSYDHTVYLDNIQFSEIVATGEDGTFEADGGYYTIDGAETDNETFRFVTNAWGAATTYDGTYYTAKGEGTVSHSAIATYGNGFLGWYDGETLVSTEAEFAADRALTPRFDRKNLLNYGDFETTLAHESIINEINGYSVKYTSAYCGTPTIVSTDGLKNCGTEYGDYALKLTPHSTSIAAKQKGLINIPVTVEKNKNYIWRFSYRYDDNAAEYNSGGKHYIYMAINGLSGGKIPWSGTEDTIKYTMHSQPAGSTKTSKGFTNGWSWGGSENGFRTLHAISDNGTSTQGKWQEVFILFNPNEDPYIFADGSDTGVAYLSIGTVNSMTDYILFDNMSVTEAVLNEEWSTVSAAANGSVATYNLGVDYYTYTPTARCDTQSFLDRDTENVYVPDMYLPVYAVANSGYKLFKWTKDGADYSKSNPAAIHTLGGNYTAVFASDASVCKVTATSPAVNGIYGGYISGQTEYAVSAGTEVTFKANTYMGNTFDGWYVGDKKVSSEEEYTFTVMEPQELVAKYNINNLWPDSGYENTIRNTDILFDKVYANDALTYSEWYSNNPSVWWHAYVRENKPHTGTASLDIIHRTNLVLRDIEGLEKNTDYTFSFYWYITNPKMGENPSYFKAVSIYGSDTLPLADYTFHTEYSTEWQKVTVHFNTGDNTNVSIGLNYYASSDGLICDDFVLTKGLDSSFVKVTYDSASDKVSDVHEFASAGSTYTLKAPLFTPAGKIFAGWSYGGNVYATGSTITLGNEDAVLTATYTDFNDKGALSDSTTYNPEDYDFSFVVLPDEQKVNSLYPGYFSDITDWIIENRELYSIKGVLSVGDITEGNSMLEWRRAKTAISKLDGVLPYVLAPGNHDYMGNSKGDYNASCERNTDYFDYFFPESEHVNNQNYGGSYNGSLTNSYYKVETEGGKFLIMALEIYPRDEVLEWANEVVSSHGDYRVIVVTHSHLDADGTRTESSESGGSDWYTFNNPENSNDANAVWNKFIKLHPNMMLYISGHNSSSKTLYSELKGDNGNTVYELLIDNQDDDNNYKGVGNIVILGFNAEDGTIKATTYSTIRDKYFMPQYNEFTLDADLVVEKSGYGHVTYEQTFKSGVWTTTYYAKPYYSNTFVGWYDADGNLITSNPTYTTVNYHSLKAVFEGANTLPNSDLEFNDDLSFTVTNKDSFSIGDYTEDEGNGEHYLYLNPAGQQTTNNGIVLDVKKNTDYVVNFDVKVTNFGSNGWFRLGIAYQLGKWDATPILNGASHTYVNTKTGYYTTHSSGVGAAHQAGGGLDSQLYSKYYDNDWVNVTLTFNSGSDDNVFHGSDEGTMYLMLYTFNNSMSVMIDNVIFGTETEVKTHINGYGTATADKQTAMPREDITYTATAGYGSAFDGWYCGNIRVSQERIFTTNEYLSLTAHFKNYGGVSDAGFENGTTGDVVTRFEGVTTENVAHSSSSDYLGNRVLKVTDTADDFLGFYFPVNAEANTKYLIHFSYKVEADADTRTDIMVGPKNTWSSFKDSTFYASSTKYSYSKTGAFGQYQSNNLALHFGSGFIEMNIIVDTANELVDNKLYILMGAQKGATFYIDNLSVTKISDIAPYMIGATLITEDTKYYKEGTLSYASGLNYISPATVLKEIGTVTMPTQLIPAGETLTKDTANVSVASLRNNEGLYFDAKQFYATFRGTDTFNPSVKLSARSYCIVSDIHGKYEWTFHSENNNEASKITNGVYDRSITQIRRLLALQMINDFAGNYPDDFYSDDDVSATDNVASSASVSSAEAWNFVKRNAYLYGNLDLKREIEEADELFINGDFEDTSAYLGAIRQNLIDPAGDGLSYTNDKNKAVFYDYDHEGWVYYSGNDYYIPDGAEFSKYIKYVDSSVTAPHSGDYSLLLSTRSGVTSHIIDDLEPYTDYEISYYWKGGTTLGIDYTYVYPYIYEFFGPETQYYVDVNDDDGDGNTTESLVVTENINGVDYRLNVITKQRYFNPDGQGLYAEGLAFDGDYVFGNNYWQKKTLKFNTGNNTAVVLGIHYNSKVNSGAIYIDDVSCKKSEPVTDSVANAQFSNGLEGWNGTASTYKVSGETSATFYKAGQHLWQTVAVERNTSYNLTIKAKTTEANALQFGVTNIAEDVLNNLNAINGEASMVTDSTGTVTYTVSFDSLSSQYVNVHLNSLVNSKVTVFSVELNKTEEPIVREHIDFEDGKYTITAGVAPLNEIKKTNTNWYALSSSAAHSGTTSLLMKANATYTAGEDYVTNDGDTLKHPLYQKWTTLHLRPGTYYKVSYYAKAMTANTSFDSSIRFVDRNDWDYLQAVDTKTVTLSNTNWTYVEHLFYVSYGLRLGYEANFVISANDNTTSNIFFDDIVLEEAIAPIETDTPDKLYTEEIFNLIPDNNIEDGAADYTKQGAQVVNGGAYNGNSFLRVNAGTKVVLPIKTYVSYNYLPDTVYTFSAAVRKSSSGAGYVGISYTEDGNSFYQDAAATGKDGSKLVPSSTSWSFGGFSYARSTVTPTYLVIECTEGYIDVDMMSLFTDLHAFETDPNVQTPGYDYDNLSGAIANGGTTLSGAVSLSINTKTPKTNLFTGVGKTVYHAFVSDCMGREYSEEQLDFELTKMREAGITLVRTMFRSEWAYTGNDLDPWNWDSDDMQQFYAWCEKLDSYGFEVAIIPAWSMPSIVYGRGSIPEVPYLYPPLLDENGKEQYTLSWGVLHKAINFDLACDRYAEFATEAIEAIYNHGVTNVTHCLTFNEPSHVNGTLYTGAHNVQMLQLVERFVDRMNATKLSNGQTVREYITLVGPNQANMYNGGLADYFLENSKYGIELYDVWSTHGVNGAIGEIVGPEGDNYAIAYNRYTQMMSNYLGKKPFWCDEFAVQGFKWEHDAESDEEQERWWGVNYAGQYVALINSGMSGGILWQYADNSWTYLAGSGGEFMYGLHMTGATRSALQTQTPYYSYYSVTLLTKYLSSSENCNSYAGTSNNDYVHTAAIKLPDGNWSILVVNNNKTSKNIKINLSSSIGGKTMYRHLYDSATVEPDSAAKILDADKTYTNVTTVINDTIPAGSVVVYTSIKG